MSSFSLTDAQNRLPELLKAARRGDNVEIAENGCRFRLILVPPIKPRQRPPVTGVPTGGQLAGQLVVPDDFDDPLEELREYME